MKRSELDKAARNALVAEKVMGRQVQWLDVVPSLPPVAVIVGENEIVGNLPNYSEDMNAAWQIVTCGKFSFVELQFISRPHTPNYLCTIILAERPADSTDEFLGSGATAQEALCLASLKACGVEIEA